MTEDADDRFYNRADAVIALVNEQMEEVDRGKVSASLMFATARFSAFVGASNAPSANDLASGKEEIIAYFVEEYRKMLGENLDDYIANFEKYTADRD